MNEQEQFNNELDAIRADLLMEVKQWWGHKFSGYKGTIITNSRDMFEYLFYNVAPDNLTDDSRYIRKVKSLNDEEFNKICGFIEDEIMNKQFNGRAIMDAGYTVVVNYNGCQKEIKNNKGYEGNLEIYDLAEKMISEIK